MGNLPVMLKVRGRQCAIIGGGAVAVRRARALVEAGAEVTVIAPEMAGELEEMPVRRVRRRYRQGDLAGVFFVVIATDDSTTNQAAAAEAAGAGALVNRADDPDAGDTTITAHARHGPITLAVDTGGIAPAAAAAIRDQLSAALDPAWPQLLEIIAPFRVRVRANCHDRALRRRVLASLTQPEMLDMLKTQGEQALRQECLRLIENRAL